MLYEHAHGAGAQACTHMHMHVYMYRHAVAEVWRAHACDVMCDVIRCDQI